MADQILARVENVSNSASYVVHVYDLFGGSTREVTGSPFALSADGSPGDISAQFPVNVDATGNGLIRCVDDASGQPLVPDAPLPNNNSNIVTIPT